MRRSFGPLLEVVVSMLGMLAARTHEDRDPPDCMWVNNPPEDPGDV
jgi:hypothetical protein